MSDLISRQAVLNLFNKSDEYRWETIWIRRKIEKLPSVEPKKCGDSINREAALEVLDDYAEDVERGNLGAAYSKARASMCELPSIEPESKLEKCNDCISRKAATDRFDLVQSDDKCMDYDDIMKFLLSLPSVKPERRLGKWMEGKKTPGYIKWNCSECGLLVRNPQKPWYEYCPKCGADMRDIPETNDKDTESEDVK